ncbi:hypothetical protein C2845_PM14G08860 [Panicum miliaceum]|uniref:Uncharacterized protein n=1 Tax=Panicum miliaceum TaxID=4540 RepID=A0A3L6PS74_PANMI|nr:hypothetical protein C2845_PM14G08860 [Panicum miliaceum]
MVACSLDCKLFPSPTGFRCSSTNYQLHNPTSFSMVKKNKVGSADVIYREKYKTWTDDSTEFMLQWYVDYQKDKPATFRWKQHHHHLCAEALNARFGIGATRHQVYRHFRALKEKWNWIRQALAKSGNGFDAASRKFNLPYSEKSPSKLGLMEELFGESGQANGSLAIDQYTSDAEDDRSETETDDSFTVEHGENDSDTIARSNSPDLAFSSGLKHKNTKSPMKKLRKHKEKRANALENDKIASSIVMLANSVASSALHLLILMLIFGSVLRIYLSHHGIRLILQPFFPSWSRCTCATT